MKNSEEMNLPKEKAGGFLPYTSHVIFDSLANDWITILKLDIPTYDLIPHLVRLAGFHMLRYQQQIARETIGENRQSFYVSEIVAPKKTMVRELSVESYQENNVISSKAVDAYILNIENSKDWQNALLSNDPYNSCLEILKQKVLWPRKETDYEGAYNPIDLITALKAAARRRHSQNFAHIHRVYRREIGLISKRGTNRLRYAPTDAFLKTLVLSSVGKRMELEHFLSEITKRYGIILGCQQAEEYAKTIQCEFDKKAFQRNSQRLEQRLSSIGMLKRLSDGCAYVLNPFAMLEDS